VKICSESGDLRDATIQNSINSDANARPSGAGDTYVLSSVGDTTIKVTGGGSAAVIAVGGVVLTVSAAGVTIVGGSVTHNGTDIGDTHTHSGIAPGLARTGDPQ